MLVLGIETSCDETAFAFVEDGELLDETLASQARLHALFGGVVPELASREHYRGAGILFDELLRRTSKKPSDIDAVAVARGPGLLGSLLVGASFAKGLALGLGCRLIGTDHLRCHALACGFADALKYPALALVVSGGHTSLFRVEAPERFIQLGRTLDDAAGEIFDKTGQTLGLPYPAGKHIDILASSGVADQQLLPRPYLNNQNLDFSFSGLKTAAINAIESLRLKGSASAPQLKNQLANFCASFNSVVCDVLEEKLSRALRQNEDVQQIWLCGGVAANSMLRKRLGEFTEKTGMPLLMPKLAHCTDNAAMIAYGGWLLSSRGFCHDLDFEAVPRGKAVPDDFLNF